MKILLVLNKPNREIPIMESIKRQILFLNPDALIEIKEMCVPGFNKFVFKYRPNVIMTFPFTCEGFSQVYYIFKFLFNTKIISFRAEGVIDFRSKYNLEWAVGMDCYGSNLVDYELFWGQKLANAVGRHLLFQNKISSKERIKITGYPRLEQYFKKELSQNSTISERIKRKIDNYDKEKIALFITGFQLADYTRQNLIDAKDLVKEDDPNFEIKINNLLDSVEIAKRFRRVWIANLIKAANENPDILIISKKHPVEKKETYKALNKCKNILFIHEDISVDDLFPFVGILFHYGSTALVDAYLSKIPSVYVHTEESQLWYPDLEWPSSIKIEANDMSKTLKKFSANGFKYRDTTDIKRILKEIFSIEDGKQYRPSKKIARILLDPSPPQKIKFSDPFLLRSIISFIFNPIFLRMINFLKRISTLNKMAQ